MFIRHITQLIMSLFQKVRLANHQANSPKDINALLCQTTLWLWA